MELNDQQRQAVRQWAAEGLGLSEIQQRIKEEFGISMTYMDVRFLVLDLDVAVADKEEPVSGTPPGDLATAAEPPPAPGPGGAGGVSVEVDVVTKPGAVVSGTAVFSDGVRAQWFLDQMGRLALDAGQPGYRPSEQDVAAFQQELQAALRKKGF